MPACPTACLHFRMANSKTAQNNRGLITSMSGKLIPECEMAGLRKELRHGQVVQQMMLFLEC